MYYVQCISISVVIIRSNRTASSAHRGRDALLHDTCGLVVWSKSLTSSCQNSAEELVSLFLNLYNRLMTNLVIIVADKCVKSHSLNIFYSQMIDYLGPMAGHHWLTILPDDRTFKRIEIVMQTVQRLYGYSDDDSIVIVWFFPQRISQCKSSASHSESKLRIYTMFYYCKNTKYTEWSS